MTSHLTTAYLSSRDLDNVKGRLEVDAVRDDRNNTVWQNCVDVIRERSAWAELQRVRGGDAVGHSFCSTK